MTADDELIGTLKSKIATRLTPFIPVGSRVAILQFPHHANVGDSAIWVGEALFLESCDADVVYVSDQYLFDEEVLRSRIGDGVIALHGGGNFGDLYPIYQEFRERLITNFPDNAIVQFPQTVHFSDSGLLEQASQNLGRHENFTVAVRDEESLALLRQSDFNTVLCPDMAFFIGPIGRSEPECDVLWLARRDREVSRPPPDMVPDKLQITDWFGESEIIGGLEWTLIDHLLVQGHWTMTRFGRRFPHVTKTLWYLLAPGYTRVAKRRFERGRRILSRGEVVISDRLHAHILCMLMGIPHVVLNDKYGKIDNFRRAWTSASALAENATTPDDAAAKAMFLLGRSP